MIRHGFIGGSDCAKIMSDDWHDLWLTKTQRKQPDDLSHLIQVQLGVFTEPFNLDWLEQDTDWTPHETQVPYTADWSGVPIKGTLDALAVNSQSHEAIVECKHTNTFTNIDKQVERYMAQMQCYMSISGINECVLSCIFGNSAYKATIVSADADYLNILKERTVKFWHYVTSDIPPENIEAADVNTDKIPLNGMKKRDASTDNHFNSVSKDFLLNQTHAKNFETAKKELKSLVKSDEREVYNDQLTVKRSKSGALTIKRRTEDGE